jgi:tyrosyl-tRNA synthetase
MYMSLNLIQELQWRGMIQDIMPGTEDQLLKEMTTGYVGFDPTSDSLHVGSLLPIMLLVHLQKSGHRPIALVGGATGMVGDPSGKSVERNLLDEQSLAKNVSGVSMQLRKFLDFDHGANKALLLNNYDWMKNFSFLEFIRDIGKHITVNYMMAKDSVKKRIETGISYTEFSYQLLQGYDFLYLHKNHSCKIQIGGSDQWGNITTGTELIRRKGEGDAFAFTCPLLTKADGGKFGKTEAGTIWLDPKKTSPYEFYQFWLNASDEDAKKLVRYFTLITKEKIESIEKAHNESPHLRILQKTIAEEVTIRVHGKEALDAAIVASTILFGKSTSTDLRKLTDEQFLEVFNGVPQAVIKRSMINDGLSIIDALVSASSFLASNGEAKRELKANAVSINKERVDEHFLIQEKDLINGRFVLIGKGKKINYLLLVKD